MKDESSQNKISDPDPGAFSRKKGRVTIPVDIRFSDTDAIGHVFFGTYFTLFDTAFLKYLNMIGYSFNRFLQNDINFYYVEAKTQYKSPIKFDDVVEVSVYVNHLGKTSFTIEFEAMNLTTDTLSALGHIVAVVVDKTTEKPCPLPHELIQAMEHSL